MLEARYKKDMNSNYLILGCEEKATYELNMICNNKIKGLLDCRRYLFNGQTELHYNITSKQPLSRVYLKKELTAEDVRKILLSIRLLMDELKKYLLSFECILFDAEYCYCNPETKQSEWIFYPQRKSESSMGKLAEFLIDRVDHGERTAVDMVYHFYKLVRNEMVTKAELDKLIEEYESDKTYEPLKCEKHDFGYEQDMQLAVQYKEADCGNDTLKSNTVWEKVKELIHTKVRIFSKEKTNKWGKRIETVNSLNWETYGLEEYENYKGETVVMGVQSIKATRRLRSLSKSDAEYISLQKLPCILGKMEECSDIVLRDQSISRMHARIFEENGELYLQDLNSTNGSYINNLELESNEIVKLKIGDEITFGNLRYIYE